MDFVITDMIPKVSRAGYLASLSHGCMMVDWLGTWAHTLIIPYVIEDGCRMTGAGASRIGSGS